MKPLQLILASFVVLVLISTGLPQIRVDEIASKNDPSINRGRGISMLKDVKKVLEEYYYDKNFRGIDLDQKFKEAETRIKGLETNAEIFRTIASLVLEFNDSHTRFYPPARSNRVEYGFSMQMIGDRCFVVNVKKGSDAERKGIKIGDQVLKIGQYKVSRNNLWVLNYFLYSLEPLPVLPVTVSDAGNTERKLTIEVSFKTLADRKKEADKNRKEKAENPYKCSQLSTALVACKLRTFSVEKKYIDRMMDEAAKGSKLILDLRGNRGGYVKIEEYLTGHFFDQEVKIADIITRKKIETRIAKPVKNGQFTGELIVLIDSDSASAAEVFSRVIQLEKRGRIVGDVSAGAVMTSYGISLANHRGVPGFETLSFYGMNVTVADVLMKDGNRLENAGVVPDRPIGPSGYALAHRNDPVLSIAAQMLGTEISPDAAGKLEFLFSKGEDDVDEEEEGDVGEP